MQARLFQNRLLNTQMIQLIFTKILENKIEKKKRQIFIGFHDVIAEILSNKKLQATVTSIYQKQKAKHFSCSFLKSYFASPKNIGLYTTHYIIMNN